MTNVVRGFLALLVAGTALFGSPVALAIDSGDIVVVSTKGEVHITTNGADRKIRAGGVLELPASVRTGRDGSVELKQGATTVSVGPDTLLEFPALEKRGAPVDRIVQPRGNAFYNIGKREGRKLRVETPYLVGVIKGTQFNVAAQDDGTTISLFEGLLEVRAADDSDVVDLKAGEIASRKRGEKSISILEMDAGKVPANGAPPVSSDDGSSAETPDPTVPRITPSNEGGDSLLVDRTPINVRADVDLDADLRNGGSLADAGSSASVSLGNAVDAGPIAADVATSTNVDLASPSVDTAVDVGVVTPVVDVDVGVSAVVDVAAGNVDLGVDAAGAGIDAGLSVADTVDTLDTVTDSVTDTVTDTVTDVGGLLNGLIRPGRK